MSTTKQDKAFSELMEGHVNVSLSNASLDEAKDYIGNEFDPDEVFDIAKLEEWARNNGYTKE